MMEVYLIFCYFIKNGNTGFFEKALKKIYIIFQASLVNKPKYVWETLC